MKTHTSSLATRLFPRLRRHLSELIRLAAPVIVTRAGLLVMSVVDAAMLGRATAEDLAYHGLGLAPFITFIVTCIGLLFGTLVMTSHAAGREQYAQCGAIWRRSLPYALLLGVIILVLCLFGEPFFRLTGQNPDIAAGAGSVILILGFGAPGSLLFFTTAFFLEGLRRPAPATIVMVAANILNAALNWVFIFGNAGAPEMGADGAALSTTIGRTLMAVALIAYVWWGLARHPGELRDGVRNRAPDGWWRGGRAHRRIGYAAGAAYSIEAGAFSAITFFAGYLSAVALAAYTIQHIMFALVFMLALGLASATSVRVGNAHGRQDWADRALAGWTGLGLVCVAMAAIGAALLAFPALIAAFYTDDGALILATTPLIALSAYALVADGGQVVMANALRGAGETWVPTAMHAFSYLCVMTPVCWYLAFTLNRGVGGLIEGIIIASLVSVILLSARFWMVSRAAKKPTHHPAA
ncbi:MAG: MATE family multidrug resistance protein [Alphaproteobacteria bacterium]|jgi:MATE family multidrug resistance protein